MGFFRSQFSDVVEWKEFREDMIFYKWNNNEIKKGSKLIIRPGQDAIFFHNGRIEGIFEQEGEYNIDSDIIPFLSTLKGFRFGFNTGLRVEVLFVNTKKFIVKWGTRSPINIPAPSFPGGIPIRANGTFSFKVSDYVQLIDNVVGVKKRYLVEDVKLRITSILDQLLMKWITKEGKNMFNLTANAYEISKGIKEDLDMEVMNNGLTITDFTIMSFNYPKEIQDRITQNASHGMIGDMERYKQVELTDAMAEGKMKGANTASDVAGMMMGMNMANEMMKNMNSSKSNEKENNNDAQSPSTSSKSNHTTTFNFCPNCGQKSNGANFCSNCGQKLK